MMRNAVVSCLVLFLSCQIGLSQKNPAAEKAGNQFVKEFVFHSASLNRDMHYLVLLPRDYASGRSFPVLYLLHGLYGDYKNWDTRTHLESAAAGLPFLIVTPDADDSWYTNSASKPADKFEDYIVKDLISEVDGRYRTVREKRERAIAGLSMGGYGSVKMVLKHPELFAFAGSLSGAFNATQNLDDLRPEFRSKLLEVFGNSGSATRKENDVLLLLKSSREYPYFYLACGTDDSFRMQIERLPRSCRCRRCRMSITRPRAGIPRKYWDAGLDPLLRAVARILSRDSAPKTTGK